MKTGDRKMVRIKREGDDSMFVECPLKACFDGAQEKAVEAVAGDMMRQRYCCTDPAYLTPEQENRIWREARQYCKDVWTQEEVEEVLNYEQIRERGN